MISVGAAALIAQVFPVAVLIIAVERRALGSEPFPQGRRAQARVAQAWWWLRYVGSGAVVAGAVLSVILCITAVSQDNPLAAESAVFVYVVGVLLALIVIGVTVSLTMRSFSGRMPGQHSDEM